MINSTAELLFDLRQNDIIGLPLRNAPLHPRLREGLRRAMNSEDKGNTVFEVAMEDGRFLSAIVSCVYAHQAPESNREPEGWVMVIQDVTHLRQAEQARVNFIHAAAHDLRNPLGVTMNALSLLGQEMFDASERQTEIMEIASDSLNRMQALIDSLLNLEHIQSGVGLQCKPVDVRDLVERGAIDIQPSLYKAQQRLQLDVPEDIPAIEGDINWLYRALINLLSNAHKYTPEQGVVGIRAYVQDDEVYIEVNDNGPGIPLEAQTRLFERFYRVPGVEAIRGSGLGLSIVKSVAEQHGGRVFVQSRVGQGSVFGMVFPVCSTL